MLKSEVCSNYEMIREPALELSSVLLASLLPSESDEGVNRTEAECVKTATPSSLQFHAFQCSRCALVVGAISIEDFYHAVVDLVSYLLTTLKQYRTPRVRMKKNNGSVCGCLLLCTG